MATVTSKGHPPISGCATVWDRGCEQRDLRADGRRSGNDDQLRGHAGGADRRHDRVAGRPVRVWAQWLPRPNRSVHRLRW